ncbi:MAG: hypothetical protein WCA43_00825, partial [Bradyrhizobium sp.]
RAAPNDSVAEFYMAKYRKISPERRLNRGTFVADCSLGRRQSPGKAASVLSMRSILKTFLRNWSAATIFRTTEIESQHCLSLVAVVDAFRVRPGGPLLKI